jgi:hypothetical protein
MQFNLLFFMYFKTKYVSLRNGIKIEKKNRMTQNIVNDFVAKT